MKSKNKKPAKKLKKNHAKNKKGGGFRISKPELKPGYVYIGDDVCQKTSYGYLDTTNGAKIYG